MSDLIEKINLARSNPTSIASAILDSLEGALDGAVTVPDPTNPWVFLLESTAITAAACMNRAEILSRRQYPKLATTDAEIYHHMADIDYAGRFGTPSVAGFYFLLSKDEIYTRAVALNGDGGKKIVIPRNTEIKLNNTVFSMEYPITIRIAAHGGLQITYDTNITTPLNVLSSNVVSWDIVNISGLDCVRIYVPMRQFKVTTYYETVQAALGFTTNYTYSDTYYYCRIHTKDYNGNWLELATTHSDQVFDSSKATALLTVTSGALKVYIPQIYFDKGLVGNQVRVDIYTTEGPVTINLIDYNPDAFTVTWRNIDGVDTGYNAPLSLFNIAKVYSDETTSGGSGEVSFDTLRTQVIEGGLGYTATPITEVQLMTALSKDGFSVVKNIDNVTNRQYIATRGMPEPVTLETSSAAGACIATLQVTYEALALYKSVVNNGVRMTVKPSQLYRFTNGLLTLVSDYDAQRIQNLGHEAYLVELNTNAYVWTPFHYVLDSADDAFDTRAYHLTQPHIKSKQFVNDSDTAEIEVGVGSHSITLTETGYQLHLITKSGDSFKALSPNDVYVQLSFRPYGEIADAFMNGIYVGATADNERVYRFDITTNYDIIATGKVPTDNHVMYLNSFTLYDDLKRNLGAVLTTKFDVLFGVTGLDLDKVKRGVVDDRLGTNWLPDDIRGVAWERLEVELGTPLVSLWTSARSVASSIKYRTYPTDVPYVYLEDVYARDPITGNIAITVDGDGKISAVKLHAQGDPILVNGQPTYRHYAGEVYRDAFNNPVPEDTRKITRQFDILALDAIYYAATDDTAVSYRKTLIKETVDWITNLQGKWWGKLLDETRILFHPKNTLGYINVVIGDGVKRSIPATMGLTVDYYVKASSAAVLLDDVQAAIRKATRATIVECLGRATVSTSDIIAKLKGVTGDDVIAISVNGLGPNNDLPTLTVVDDSARCSVRKKLVLLPENTYSVVDDITINFIKPAKAT